MIKKTNPYEIHNIVTIGDREKVENYYRAIVMRYRPIIYNKYKCIILQFRSSLHDFAYSIINDFKYAGLRIVSEEHKPIKQADGFLLPDAWEIKLEKIPVLASADYEDDR